MFSLLLSSEGDFPVSMDTSKPECSAVPHPPVIEAAPTIQGQYPLPYSPPPSLPPPTSVPSSVSVPNATSISALPPSSTPSTATHPGPQKRPCDDDVQFVSEKPVKRRRLESPAPPDLVNVPQQKAVSPQDGPMLSHAAAQPVQEGGHILVRPVTNLTHEPTAGLRHESQKGEAERMARRASLSCLDQFVLPTKFPSGQAVSRKESPPISPKQVPGAVPVGLLQRPSSQPLTTSGSSLGSLQDSAGNGRPDPSVVRNDPENGIGTFPALSSRNAPLNGNTELAKTGVDVSVAQQVQPVGEETGPPGTVSPRNPTMSASEAPHGNGPAAKVNKPFIPHHRFKSQDAIHRQQQRPTTPRPTVLPGGQSSSWPSTPTTAPPQAQSISSANFAPRAHPSSQQNPTTEDQCSRPAQALPSNETIARRGPRFPPATPKTATSQPMGVTGPTKPQGLHRSPTQSQAQLSSPFPARPQRQMYSQTHAQNRHRIGHPSGPGLPKAPCQICAARRQKMARQKAAAGGSGMAAFPNGAFPPGTMPQHPHAPSVSGTGYNVVFVPTPVQGSNGSGAQFTHPNQATSNPAGAMGRPHAYMLQNPQPGPTMLSSVPQARRITNMPNQTTPPGPEPRTSPQQIPPTRKFPHQEPSAGKHIIVDIADTAMEVFPFSKVAKRHNVSVDKVRNIFEAVVAVPFLRVPADKRRAGKVGQERVKGYLAAKKEMEREGGGRDGVSAYEVARVMGPEVPGEWAQGHQGPW